MKSKLSQCSPEHARNSQELNGMSMDDNHSDRMMYLAMFVTVFAYVFQEEAAIQQDAMQRLQYPQAEAASDHMYKPICREQLPPGAKVSGHGDPPLAITDAVAGLPKETTAAPPMEMPAVAPMSMEQAQAQMALLQSYMQMTNSAKANILRVCVLPRCQRNAHN